MRLRVDRHWVRVEKNSEKKISENSSHCKNLLKLLQELIELVQTLTWGSKAGPVITNDAFVWADTDYLLFGWDYEKPCLGFSGSTLLYPICFCDLTAGLGLATGEISGLTEQKSFGELLSDHVLNHSYLWYSGRLIVWDI